jgi:diguanylate cyclase (GGDEF)-like protein/PAS domain S-box-containing protein
VQPANPGPERRPGPGEAFFRVLLEDYTDVIVVLGEDGAIRYATPSAAALFGPGPVIGACLPDLVGDNARPEVARAVGQMLARAGPDPGAGEQTWQIAGPHGQAVYVQVRVSDLRAAPAVGGLVLTLRDVTSQHRTEDQLRHQALHDELTGLPTRRLLGRRAAHAVGAAHWAGTTAAILFIDLDDFKEVNETLGHATGDELLAAAGARLAQAVREADTTARIGGDEFAILLEDLSDPAAAGPFGDRVVQAFTAPFVLAAGQISIGVSVGMATSADAADAVGLLVSADLALAAAKAAGKQQWRAYDPAMARGRDGVISAARQVWAAFLADLDFPDPRPGLAGRRAPGGTAGPRTRTTTGQGRRPPQITP